MNVKTISIGCDHAGFPYKDAVKAMLTTMGIEVKDYGTYSLDSVDYPDFVHPVANDVENAQADFGVLLCGSGNGVAITANKHQGIRAALCWIEEIAALARQHNNANIVCLPVRFTTLEQAEAIVKTFLSAEFEGGRHAQRVDKIPLGC